MVSRRHFLVGAAGLAFAGLSYSFLGKQQTKGMNPPTPTTTGYGPLVTDPNKLLDLLEGFSYRVISKLDDVMSDGLPVPDRADGMGCFELGEDRVVLIRNHELHPRNLKESAKQLRELKSDAAYDSFSDGVALPGGTTNLVYNLKTGEVEQEFLSLIGTSRNCAGGVTPWRTWLTCEESVIRTGEKDNKKDHGYIFEVPADAKGLVQPEPLTAMGRFNHEAVAVDPRTGILYLTEDRGDSLFYRFIPNVPGKLNQGGKLQALVFKGLPKFDTRNWDDFSMPINDWYQTEWIDLTNPEAPDDDLRLRGYEDGAAIFARGEGIHYDNNEFYFCCTNGGKHKYGQIMRYQPSAFEGQAKEQQHPGQIQLFLESSSETLFNFGDNLTVTPQGHLLVCEDQYTANVANHLRGVDPQGRTYPFGKIHLQTEPAGVCFSPDGQSLFVNIYSPTMTLVIDGPWQQFKS